MEVKNIVVMGGSFNPPTIAHFRIMQTALQAADADLGFFVPVSYPYLRRKMAKAGQSHLSLPDELRIEMLEAMIGADARIRVYREAMGNVFSDDAGLIAAIQEKYPGATLYYVFGDDKLELLDNFARKSDFFDRTRCILFSRDSGRLTERIGEYEHLSVHRDALVYAGFVDGLETVSSTRIREHLFDVDAVADMLHPAVLPVLRRLKREDYPEEIIQFRDEFAFLSNDFPAKTAVEGLTYPCAASAFIASKFENRADRARIAAMSPDRAKQKYSSVPGYPGWEENQTRIMEEIVREKFLQNPDLAERLLETGARRLINGGKKDQLWGVNLITWQGDNRLGAILMKIRDEWREKDEV